MKYIVFVNLQLELWILTRDLDTRPDPIRPNLKFYKNCYLCEYRSDWNDYTRPVHFWLFGFLIGFWVDNYWLMKLCDLINNTNFQNNKKVGFFFDYIFKNKQTENKTNAGWIKVEIFSISDLPYSIFDFDHVLGLVNGFLIKNPNNQKWIGLILKDLASIRIVWFHWLISRILIGW